MLDLFSALRGFEAPDSTGNALPREGPVPALSAILFGPPFADNVLLPHHGLELRGDAQRHVETAVRSQGQRIIYEGLGVGKAHLAFARRAALEADRGQPCSELSAFVVAMAIVDLLRDDNHPRGWSGTATRLLEVLSPMVSEALKKTKLWPSTAQGMGNQIDRVKPLLRQRGIIIERKKSGERTISIMPKDPAS